MKKFPYSQAYNVENKIKSPMDMMNNLKSK